MVEFLLVIHLLLALSLIGVVLLQRSEGGGLGIGGSSGGGGMGGFMTGRGTKSLLTRTTAILAACFMITSLSLAWVESRSVGGGSLIDTLPTTVPAESLPEPTTPSEPSVPVQ